MDKRKFLISSIIVVGILSATFYLMQNCGRVGDDHRSLNAQNAKSAPASQDQALAPTAAIGRTISIDPNYIADRDPMVPFDPTAATRCEVLVRDTIFGCDNLEFYPGYNISTFPGANTDPAICAKEAERAYHACETKSFQPYVNLIGATTASFYKGKKLLSSTSYTKNRSAEVANKTETVALSCQIQIRTCPGHPEAVGYILEPERHWYQNFEEPIPQYGTIPYVDKGDYSGAGFTVIAGLNCRNRARQYQEWCGTQQPVNYIVLGSYGFVQAGSIPSDPTKVGHSPESYRKAGCGDLDSAHFVSRNGGCEVVSNDAQASKGLVTYIEEQFSLTFDQAQAYCSSLVANNYDDWRLMTAEENQDLIIPTRAERGPFPM